YNRTDKMRHQLVTVGVPVRRMISQMEVLLVFKYAPCQKIMRYVISFCKSIYYLYLIKTQITGNHHQGNIFLFAESIEQLKSCPHAFPLYFILCGRLCYFSSGCGTRINSGFQQKYITRNNQLPVKIGIVGDP